MDAENVSNPPVAKIPPNEIIKRGIKELLSMDEDLKFYNRKEDILSEECRAINATIACNTAKVNDIADDVQLCRILTQIFKLINGKKELIPGELKKVVDKKLEYQRVLGKTHIFMKGHMEQIKKDVKAMKEQVETATKNLKNEGNYLNHFKKWVRILTDRKLALINEIKKLEEAKKTQNVENIPVDVGDNTLDASMLQNVQNYGQMNIQEKIDFFNETVTSLQTTLEEYYNTVSLIVTIKVNVEGLKNKILAKEVEMEKILLEEIFLEDRIRVNDRHVEICTKVLNEPQIEQKAKITEQYLQGLKERVSETKQVLTEYREQLFIQTLKLTTTQANIQIILLKREHLEAQIAIDLSEQ